MSYKIAIASSDGKNINLSFGAVNYWDIYEVNGIEYHFLEKRLSEVSENASLKLRKDDCQKQKSCGSNSGCGTGGGCGSAGGLLKKIELISDCRAIVCKKIGFNVVKQLEKKTISGFDVECGVEEALDKIVYYYNKVDLHQTLRKSAIN